MVMAFLAQEGTSEVAAEPTNAAAKEAGAFLMVALLAMGGAAIMAMLTLIIMGRRLRKRKAKEDWRQDWKLEDEGAATDAWQASGEGVRGKEFEDDDEEENGDGQQEED